jgi:hypothetical protein
VTSYVPGDDRAQAQVSLSESRPPNLRAVAVEAFANRFRAFTNVDGDWHHYDEMYSTQSS